MKQEIIKEDIQELVKAYELVDSANEILANLAMKDNEINIAKETSSVTLSHIRQAISANFNPDTISILSKFEGKIIKGCVVCGKPFVIKRQCRKKYCSKPCRDRAKYRRRKQLD